MSELPFIPELPGQKNVIARAYNSHYELINYNMGDCKKIEYDLSIFENKPYPKKTEYYYYDKNAKILYVPRGYDASRIAEQTGRPITFMPFEAPKNKYHFTVGNPPKDEYQQEMIRFLAALGEYQNLISTSQQVLSIPTRSGKTYCTIAATSILECKAMIIVNTDTLRQQWKDEVITHTQLAESNVMMLSSSKIFVDLASAKQREIRDKYIFIVTHRTIHNVIEDYGLDAVQNTLKHLDIGIKIVDEAHKEFRNTLMTDYATNVWKTYYLTATFARADNKENRVFQNSFNQVVKINKKNPNREKTVKLFSILFNSHPTRYEDQDICYSGKGFSRHKYIEYEMNKPNLDNMVKMVLKICLEEKQLEGKILILSSKIDSCNHFRDLVKSIYPAYTVCAHHSQNSVPEFREYGVVCTTPQMLGTGTTIPKLRVVINTEPTANTVNIVQTFGRLDIYAPNMDTYYFIISDKGFSKVEKMANSAKKLLTKYAKEVYVWDATIIK